ncbi:DUF1963 domain-containing protein [Bifidobacterium tissieri]|uniref:DUF1963 domain-containing protein n=2 Tax=Bifidobacterium tissieri TaxID=1630162 RepID=A0A5M9ZMY9_9BIFI|nr:DUF1963 domain-containing protein [Bifidobacterium tissieri]KAA8832942.1 DUF1963 domain-containing protein [Bifidobacterium tissieri]
MNIMMPDTTPSSQSPTQSPLPSETERLADRIVDMIRTQTGKPAIELHVEAADGTAIDGKRLRDCGMDALAVPDLLDTKYGGPFLLPDDYELPVNPGNGVPMVLLAQWNFERLPRLEGFPQNGLLQCFVDATDDDLDQDVTQTTDDGNDGNDDSENDKAWESWKIRYIPANLLSTDAPHAAQVITPHWQLYHGCVKPTQVPFDDENMQFKLHGELTTSPMGVTDYRYEDLLESCLDQLDEEDRELFDDEYADMENLLFQRISGDGHRLGGYPLFTQDDPRTYMDEDEAADLVMVAQINSIEFKMMFGDNGIGHIFIPSAALHDTDFSQAFYQWDCY